MRKSGKWEQERKEMDEAFQRLALFAKEKLSTVGSNAIEILLSDDPDALKIRSWFQSNKAVGNFPPPCLLLKRKLSDEGLSATEIELVCLSYHFFQHDRDPFSKWNVASADSRKAHSNRVSRLARELAIALNEETRPEYLPVISYYDDERIVDMVSALAGGTALNILRGTGYEPLETFGEAEDASHPYSRSEPTVNDEGCIGYFTPAGRVLNYMCMFSEQQSMGSLLENLAKYTEQKLVEPKPDMRPNYKKPAMRTYARELSKYFQNGFGKPAHSVVAACISLKFDPENGITDEDVRKWLGKK